MQSDILMTPVHIAFQVRCSGRVEPELDGLPGRPYNVTSREGSMPMSTQPTGCTPWCFTDAAVAVRDFNVQQ